MGKQGYLYFGIGTALVPADQMKSLIQSPEYQSWAAAVMNGQSPLPLAIYKSGYVSAEQFKKQNKMGEQSAKTKIGNFSPIGLGKPLSIRREQVYTGDFPKGINVPGVYKEQNPTRAVLLSSAVKSIYTFDAQPRAINALIPGVGQKQRFTPGQAMHVGTPLIYYTPAARDQSISLQIEMKFQDFDKAAFDIFSKIFTSAGTTGSLIPPFQAASSFLITTGQLIRITGEVFKSLFS